MPRFRAARAKGDADTAMRAAHDLKSEAGTLGMHDLHEAAAELEQACVDGVRDTGVDELIAKVSKRLAAVIDKLRALETERAS